MNSQRHHLRGLISARALASLVAAPIAAAALFIASSGTVAAQSADNYPSKPIRFIVPYSAGGGSDVAARQMAQRLSERLGQMIIVENRGGAGGNIGGDAVAKAAPDGYTMLLGSSAVTINPSVYPKMPFDVTKDLKPVAVGVSTSMFLFANATAPVGNLAELLSYAKANPGALTYASSGIGTTTHLAVELFKARAGIDMLHVPYKGSGSAVNDVISGQVHLFAATPAAVGDFVKSGKLRPIATMDEKRAAGFEQVPAIAERVPGFEVRIWLGIMMPAGTPDPIVAKVAAALQSSLNDKEFRDSLAKVGFAPSYMGPKDMAALIRSDLQKWAVAVKSANVTAQ
ncbi:MAG: tripartite tricarboxylate transporter substrate binding protein [Noviherbaspirillum sp.]|nr:tripartite tricarboxylate transporter substrate binding protein [Noviherbaspirillum sp.]